MKVRVDPELCTGCGPCVELCSEVFQLKDDKAIVQVEDVPTDLQDSVRAAADACPTGAIVIEE
jgi:ferredoxin